MYIVDIKLSTQKWCDTGENQKWAHCNRFLKPYYDTALFSLSSIIILANAIFKKEVNGSISNNDFDCFKLDLMHLILDLKVKK